MSMELARLRASCVFAGPRIVFEQNVATDDHGGGALADRLFLADHDLGDVADQLGEQFMEFGDVGLRRGHHGRSHGRLRGLDAWCRSLRELARCHYGSRLRLW